MTATKIEVGARVRATKDFGLPGIVPGTEGTVLAVYAQSFAYPYRVLFDGDTQFPSYGRICVREELEVIK